MRREWERVGAAIPLPHAQVHQSEVEVPRRPQDPAAVVDEECAPRRRKVVQLAHRVSMGGTWDGVQRRREGYGSLGRPSTRSPMMLRWISEVPPAIVRLRAKRNCSDHAAAGPSATAPAAPNSASPTSCTRWSCSTPSSLRTDASEPEGSAPPRADSISRYPSTESA